MKDGNNMELPEVNKPKDYHLPGRSYDAVTNQIGSWLNEYHLYAINCFPAPNIVNEVFFFL